MRMTPTELHQKHKEYLMENTPTDRIIEDRGIDNYGKTYSEFVTSAGGDVTVYRVYGDYPAQFKCVIK